jgi:hypothetical protein
MEIHPLEFHRSNNNNSTNYCRSASLNMHHQYHGETVVATPLPHHHQYHGHWSQPLCNSTTVNSSSNSNKKRDFHFQVIEVNQGPKWFIWPSQKSTDQSSESANSSKNSSNQENENHFHKNGAVTPNVVSPNAPMTINVAHLQRKNRFSRRKQLTEMHHHCASVIDGEYAQCTATNSTSDAPLSEPTTRRLLSKPIICVTEAQQQESSCSTSMPSQTFKILSVSKKSWESDDEDGEQYCSSCRKMSLSLDDDCELPPRAHCAAVSGSSIGSFISTASSSSTASSNRSSDDSGVGINNNKINNNNF